MLTSEALAFTIRLFDKKGSPYALQADTPIEILFGKGVDLSMVEYSTAIMQDSVTVTLVFFNPGTYFIAGYRLGGFEFTPEVTNGP